MPQKAATTRSEVLNRDIGLELPGGRILRGRLEYFPQGATLAIFSSDDDLNTDITVLTVKTEEIPLTYSAPSPRHVLICNWTDSRGVASALVDAGVIELTGQEIRVGVFSMQALVARVL